jgi:hypothetical protein
LLGCGALPDAGRALLESSGFAGRLLAPPE